MVSLTWQSMNIDGYLQRIHQGLVKFDELVDKINDIIDNRVEVQPSLNLAMQPTACHVQYTHVMRVQVNLRLISRTVLVSMPADASFTLQEFVKLQERTMQRKQVDPFNISDNDVPYASCNFRPVTTKTTRHCSIKHASDRRESVGLPSLAAWGVSYLRTFLFGDAAAVALPQVLMDQKNLEVERAVIDLVEQVQAYPLESSVSDVIDEEIDVLMDHYQRLMCAMSTLEYLE
jgi:hypothetical protein